jgi:hypothetical protein
MTKKANNMKQRNSAAALAAHLAYLQTHRRRVQTDTDATKPNGKASHLHIVVADRAQLPAVIPKIRLIPFEQITLDCTQEEWTVKGITPREGLGVMWGPSQTYKSFIELDQGLRIALGWKYRGRHVQQGPVVYCAFEGGKGVNKRVEAWRRRFLPTDYAEVVPFYLVPARLNMLKQAQELIDAIERQTDGNTPVKVTLDTLNRSMVGSESSDADMSGYLAAIDALREKFNCFVNVIHHPGWDTSRSRGHSSLPAGVDVELAATSADKLASEIEVKKMKDEETGLILASRLEKVHLGTDRDGDPITSLVVIPAEAQAVRTEARIQLTKNQQTVFAILLAAGQGGLDLAEWNNRAREADIGVKRKADLVDIRMALKGKRLIYEYNERWFISNPQTEEGE